MPKDAPISDPLNPTSGHHEAVPVKVGDVLAGKYRVESVLGIGGMGVVVAATHLQLEQRVALKFMLPSAMKDPSMAERFVREARAAVRLKSEHATKILDVGHLENSTPYMVMELLEGTDLRAIAKAGPTLPINHVVAYVLQACEAVAEAHSLGIVHRDIKPHNLFLTRKPSGHACVKVLDFGISKTLDAITSDSSLTRTQAVMGSPHYMAPEQMRSARSVDARADVWALGVCLYQFISGHVPFEAETLLELGGKVLHEPPTPIGTYRQGVPPELETILLRSLAKDVSQRYMNAGELAAALEQFLVATAAPGTWTGPQPALAAMAAANAIPGAAAAPAQQGGPSYSGGRTGVAWGEGTGAPAAKRPIVLVAVGTFVAVLLVVSAVLFALARGRQPAAAASPPPPVELPAATKATPPPAPAPGPTESPPSTASPPSPAMPPSTGAVLNPATPPPKLPPATPSEPSTAKPDSTPAPASTHHHHHDTTPAAPPANAFDHL